MKGLKIQIDKGGDGVLDFFSTNTKEDFNKAMLLTSHNVTADKIACYELSDEDTRYVVYMGCGQFNTNLINVDQRYMDLSISGKIVCNQRTYTVAYDANEVGYDDSIEDIQYPETAVYTPVDTVLREIIGTLVV